MISVFACMICNSKKLRTGFSLIEAITYVALLGVISVFIANSVIFLVQAYARARAEREVLANARSLTDHLATKIASSQETYGFASQFDMDAGQLSLVSAVAPTAGHTTGYADFWMDNGVAYMREEGDAATPLSAATVRVTAFRFERIIQTVGREAVRMTIRIDAASPKFPASATLITTTALRGNY